jgi:uncharacterized protein with ParB-like and HNH nuclease domain
MLDAYKKNYKQFCNSYPRVTIPSYQRGYVWGAGEWEDFYNDILNIIKLDFKPHFMGTLLLKENAATYEIVDGQQRLITLSLFLMAYRDAYADKLTISYILPLLEKRIVVHDKNNVFDAIYNKTYLESERTLTEQESINLEQAYLYFLKKFRRKGLFGKVSTDFNLYRILNKLFFITIEIKDGANPYLIFETLNARGVDLNISDLVKNHLIDQTKGNPEFSEFVHREWGVLTSNLNDSFEKVFQSFYQSSSNRKKLLKEITVNVNEEDEVRDFLRNLGSYVKLYKKLEDDTATTWNGNQDYIRFVKSLKSFENSDLLKILAIPILTSYPRRLRIGALKFLEAFVFRYSIICQKDINLLEEKLYSVAKKINDKTIKKTQDLKLEFNEFLVTDEEFLFSFAYRSIEYSHGYSNPMVRYIIYKIENYLVREERYIIGVSDASIEHIGSQSHTLLNELYRLGNYALLARDENSNAGNKNFITKKEEYYANSTFEITNGAATSEVKSLTTYNVWNLENINTRQLEMAEVAKKVWKL